MREIKVGCRKIFIIEKTIDKNDSREVLIAKDDHLKRRVLLKIFSLSKDKKEYELINNEILSQISVNKKCEYTPMIYNTYYDRENDKFYIEMEYIERGMSLNEFISEYKQARFERKIAIFKNICRTLENIHKVSGFVHKDLKPQNIIINEESNCAYVLDFGISGFGYYKGSGTEGYMAPEQRMENKGIQVCQASDIYALGIIGIELFSGKHLIYGQDLIKNPIEYEWKQEPNYDELIENKKLCNVLKRCIRVNPKDRYNSASNLFAELKSIK